jgi:hypothetical protein
MRNPPDTSAERSGSDEWKRLRARHLRADHPARGSGHLAGVLGRPRARLGEREQAYHQLAAQATEAQRQIAEDLGRATGELTELRQRVAAMEKLLREVD